MEIIHTISAMQLWALEQKRAGKVIGLIPTMGFLHEGHLSLLGTARSNGAEMLVLSIFVNPTQFAPNEDFDKYPRDFERDVSLCKAHGVDVIFAPSSNEMYASDRSTWVLEEKLSQGLCAESRPTHFRGVTTVVAKLFNAVLPDLAVFGQKDAQQVAVIRRMVRDLNFPIQIIAAPIIREADGLAMSSRNKYLSDKERVQALALSQSIFLMKALLENGIENDFANLLGGVREAVVSAGGKIDYVELRDVETLAPADGNSRNLLLLVAACFGKTRLIDNIFIRL